jgi:hypothetical protein
MRRRYCTNRRTVFHPRLHFRFDAYAPALRAQCNTGAIPMTTKSTAVSLALASAPTVASAKFDARDAMGLLIATNIVVGYGTTCSHCTGI